jgi:hypothetical protein
MLIRTIHPRINCGLDNEQYEFKLVEATGKVWFYEGEVPDEVGKHFLAIKRTPFEYSDVTSKEPVAPVAKEPVAEPEPEVVDKLRKWQRKPKAKNKCYYS